MALILADSFDHYANGWTSDPWVIGPWTGNTGFYNGWGGASGGRFASGKMYQFGNNDNAGLYRTLASPTTNTVYFSGAVYPTQSPVGGQTNLNAFIGWTDGASDQIKIVFVGNGDIGVNRGATRIATFANAWISGTWTSFQIKVVFHATAGEVRIRKNGSLTDDYVVSSVNTMNTANAYADGVRIGQVSSGYSGTYFDDVVFYDSSGSYMNTWAGDLRIYTLAPNGAGSVNNFTITGAATNWQAASQIPPDGDTTYNASATVGNHDLFAMANLPSTPLTIHALVQRTIARKSDAGSRSLQNEIKSGATTVQGTSVALSSSYMALIDVWANDPNTGTGWTEAGVAAVEAGYKVSA